MMIVALFPAAMAVIEMKVRGQYVWSIPVRHLLCGQPAAQGGCGHLWALLAQATGVLQFVKPQ
eukprot:10002595-Karenia_brevis.AAC.1